MLIYAHIKRQTQCILQFGYCEGYASLNSLVLHAHTPCSRPATSVLCVEIRCAPMVTINYISGFSGTLRGWAYKCAIGTLYSSDRYHAINWLSGTVIYQINMVDFSVGIDWIQLTFKNILNKSALKHRQYPQSGSSELAPGGSWHFLDS